VVQQLIRELDDDGNPWTIEHLLEALDMHITYAPDHGTNCACMDGYIRVLRRMFGLTGIRPGPGGWDAFDMTAYLKGPEHQKFQRLTYILGVVARSDPF